MPGATAAGSPSKYITAALADLFSCIGGGDIVSAKALLEGKHNDKEAILSATNPAGITLLQHACHSGQAGGVNMLLEKVGTVDGCFLFVSGSRTRCVGV